MDRVKREIFFDTESDPSDFDSFEQFLYVSDDPPYILGERIIPRATRSGRSICRNTRIWEVDEFEGGDAPSGAKEEFKKRYRI